MSKSKFIRHNISREIVILLVLLGVATVLRLYKLGTWSLWVDEAFTIHDALHKSFGGKPINYVLVRFFLVNFGVSEWTARIGPAIAGIVSIIVSYYFFKNMASRQEAFWGAFFLALSSWHIYWSQNSRHYALLLLFGLLWLWLFYHGFENDKPLVILLSHAFAGLAVKTHPSIVFLAPALSVYLLVVYIVKAFRSEGYNGKNLLIFFCPLIVAGLIVGPGYLKTLAHFSSFRGSGSPLHVIHTTLYYVQIPFFTLTFFEVVHLIHSRDRRGLFLALSAYIPFIILITIAIFTRVSSLYIFYTLPIYCIVASLFLGNLKNNKHTVKRNYLRVAILATLILLQASYVYFYFTYQHGDRPRWKEAAKYVQDHAGKNELIFSNIPSVLEYYLTSKKSIKEHEIDLRKPKRVFPLEYERIKKKAAENIRCWLVINCSMDQLYAKLGVNEAEMEGKLIILKQLPAWTGGKDRSISILSVHSNKF